jgi:phospholipase C
VAPPNSAKPPDPSKPAGQDGFLFNRFGLRVPAVMVSPWIEAGTICRPAGETPFDHTSIIATVRKLCGLHEALTERDKAAPDLGCALTLATPRTDKPTVQPLPHEPSFDHTHVNDLHRLVADLLETTTDSTQKSIAR